MRGEILGRGRRVVDKVKSRFEMQMNTLSLSSRFDGRRGVRLKGTRWDSAQAGRHALDRQGRQRHHGPARSKLSGRFEDFCERRSERKQPAA